MFAFTVVKLNKVMYLERLLSILEFNIHAHGRAQHMVVWSIPIFMPITPIQKQILVAFILLLLHIDSVHYHT